MNPERKLPNYVRFEENQAERSEAGPGGVPKGARTSDYYRTKNLPEKFDYPDCFKGYEGKKMNALYRTTSSDYGSRAPNVHTMPLIYAPSTNEFTNHLGPCGMYRNRSLNTALDRNRFTDM